MAVRFRVWAEERSPGSRENFNPPKPAGGGAGAGAGLGDPELDGGAGVMSKAGGKGGWVTFGSPVDEGSDLIFKGKEEEDEEPGFGRSS